MKKVLLTVMAAASIQVAVAQNGAVNSAVLNHKNGVLDKAQADIDKAIEHKKTMDKAKTWYYRGVIYHDMIGNPVYGKNVTEKTPELVLEAYNKTLELDGKDGEFGKLVPERKNLLWGQTFNKAIEHHNEQEWDKALEQYDFALRVNPQDTTVVKYSALAATGKGDYPAAIKHYDKLLSMGHKEESTYKAKLQLMTATEASTDEILKVVQDGLKEFPNSVFMMQEELRILLSENKGDEAYAKLEKAIAADPNNASLYAVLGSLQERRKDFDGAYNSYKKATEVDPNNFDAFYNLGVIEFNKASDYVNQAAKMDYATYQKKGKPLEAQAKKHFEASLPYFETAHKIQPQDIATVQNLMKVYTRLNRKADADRMSKLLDK